MGNALRLPAPSAALTDAGGERPAEAWHHIEVNLRLNHITDGKALRDGQVTLRVDGSVALDRHDLLFRTANQPDVRFNQFILAPWCDSVPQDQTFWIDDLTLTADPQPELGRSTP